MKTKLSKRLLSMLLAVMMVVTSIPMMAFTVFADDTDAVTEAMAEYKKAMDGTVYKNMTAAYNAYVDAQKALDAFKYGDVSVDLAAKANALTTATNAMKQQVWTPVTASNPAAADGSYSSSSLTGGDIMSNVLYTYGVSDKAAYKNTSTDNTEFGAQYGAMVFLYDGGTMACPVNLYYHRSSLTGTRRLRSFRPTTADFSLVKNWHGESSSTGYQTGTGSTGVSMTDNDSSVSTNNTRTMQYQSNTLYYTGTLGDTEYSRTITAIEWIGYNNNGKSATTTLDANANNSGNTLPYVYVVNYKTLLDKIDANKSYLSSVSSYTQGGLASMISAIDMATAVNPAAYDYAKDQAIAVTNCSNAIKAAAEAFNTTVTADDANYQTLRDAMDADGVKKVFIGGQNGYTEDSWKAFEAAYTNARDLMAGVLTNGYTNGAAAKTYADAVETTYGALEMRVSKVDTTELVAAIDKFDKYINMFTKATADPVIDVLNAAKAAVWGSADNYKVLKEALDDTEANRAIVTQQLANIMEAVKSLRISRDFDVEMSDGSMHSYNDLYNLKNTLNSNDYANYEVFRTALVAAEEYADLHDRTEFYSCEDQLAEYTAEVQKLFDAYNALNYSFLKIPNGTVATVGNQASIETITHGRDKSFNSYMDFSYPSSATIIRTTHDASNVVYGEAYTKYSVHVPDNPGKAENNSLDSITINGTAAAADSVSGKYEINSNNGSTKALSDPNGYYTAGLTNGVFSLSNFSVVESYNNRFNYYGTTAEGNRIDTKIAPNDEYTKMLATTDGTANAPSTGAINIHPSSENMVAYTTLASDVSINLPATQSSTGRADFPKTTTYRLSDDGKEHYFGATYVWTYQPGLYYSGYSYFSSKHTAQSPQVALTVEVADISNLVDLVAECDAKVAEAGKYTEDTWAAFATALENAKKDYDYSGKTASAISGECATRYTNLYNARERLKERTFTATFNYKTANGADTATTVQFNYNQTINDQIAKINAISTPNYIADNHTWTFTGWVNAATNEPLSNDTVITKDLVYNAKYEGKINLADFTDLINAKDALLGALTDKTFTTADVQAIADEIAEMKYIAYDKAAQDATYADEQDAIDAETAKLVELKNGLTPSAVTVDAFDAAVDEQNLAISAVDPDQINVSSLDKIDYDSVVVTASKVVRTIPYATQNELDQATKAILEGLNKNIQSYSVKLNGEVIKGLEAVPYGTAVIVNSDGTYQLNVADTNENYDGKSVDWSYSYDAPSRGNNGFTTPKYIVTAPSFGFIVKGDTELTSAAVAAEKDNTFVVTVKSSTGKIIDVQTTTGSYTMPTAPLYANWIFDSFSNGAAEKQMITVTEDTEIIANYAARTAKNYHIDVFKSLADWQTVTNMESYDKDYNTRLDLTSDDAYCWVSAIFDDPTGCSYYTVISWNKDYSFYAYRAYDNTNGEAIVALSYDEYVSLVKAQTSVDSLLGDISLNENGIYDFIVATDGTPILAEAKLVRGSYTVGDAPAPLPAVTASSKVVPVYINNNTTVGEFAMIGSFVLPEGYKVLEYGILFTGSSTADLSVDNVGTDSKVARYKASRYTVGNQFVINMANFSRNVDFRYRAYAIIEDANGNAVTYYSNVCNGNNYSF